MKKPVIYSLIIVIIAFLLFSVFNMKNGKRDFDPEYQNSQELVNKYLSKETTKKTSFAWPFFVSDFGWIIDTTQSYSNLRNERINEIKKISSTWVGKINLIWKKIQEIIQIKSNYINLVIQKKPELKNLLDSKFSDEDYLSIKLQIDNLNELNKLSISSKDSTVKWFLDYIIYKEIIRLSDSTTKNILSNISRLWALSAFMNKLDNDLFSEPNKNLEIDINNISPETNELINEIYYIDANLYKWEKIIFTSDYYFAKEATVFLDWQLKSLKETIDKNKDWNKPWVSPLIIEVIESKYNNYYSKNEEIKKYINENSNSNLLISWIYNEPKTEFWIIQHANAYQTDFFKSLSSKIEWSIKVIKNTKDFVIWWFQLWAEEARKLYDKSWAQEILKDGWQIIWTWLEATNHVVELWVDAVQWIYFQDTSFKDFQNNIESRAKSLNEKFVKWSLWTNQYDEVLKIVSQVEKSTEKALEWTSVLAWVVTWAWVKAVTQDSKIAKYSENFIRDVTKNVFEETKATIDSSMILLKHGTIILHPEKWTQETLSSIVDLGSVVVQELMPKENEEDKSIWEKFKDKAIEKVKSDTWIDKIENLTDPEKYLKWVKDSFNEEISKTVSKEFLKESRQKMTSYQTTIKTKYNDLPTEEELLKEFFDLVDKELAKENNNIQKDTWETQKNEIIPTEIKENNVEAKWNFSWDYAGALTLRFKPSWNSTIDWTMANEDGTISINGSVDSNKVISARLSWSVKIELYDWEKIVVSYCQMTGTFTWNIWDKQANGNYSWLCGEYDGRGNWNINR